MSLTKLEAVNIVLDAIGESPVSSLTSGLPDAEAAEAKVDEVRVEILSRGWHQNMEKSVKLKRDANNNILLSNTYLRVDTTGADKDLNVTQRVTGGKRLLFDVVKRTFLFERDVEADVIVDIPFDELTIELQNYIAARAARKFQESALGSASLDAFTVRAEAEAWAGLQDAEAENEDNNILRESPHLAYATYRNSPHWGR
jgi:hypothetical protein